MPRNLEKRFAARMMPMAGLAGVIVAFLPPLLYWILASERLDRQAQVHAEHMALALSDVARRQPYLWMYNAPKVIEAIASHRTVQELGAARIVGCDGETLFSSRELELGSGGDGPVGWAPVRGPRATVAWVQVTMDSGPEVKIAQQLGLGSLLVGLLLGGALFVIPTRVVRRQARQLERTLMRLEKTEADLVESNRGLQMRVDAATHEVKELSRRVVSTQEEERRRIARELHDGLGQMLTAMRFELERPNARERSLRMSDLVMTELRRIVRALRPVELEVMPFVEVLRHTSERFEERTGTLTSLRAQSDLQLSDEVALCVLRVIQEALTNIGRHAEATEVGISLIYDDGRVILEVVDDGIGFDPDNVPSPGLGLRSMKERFRFLGGTLTIVAEPGNGTRIRGVIPMEGQATGGPAPREDT